MPSNMGALSCVATASPRLPKPKNARRAPVVGSALAEVDVLGLRDHQSGRHPENRKQSTCSGRMAVVRIQTNESILHENVDGFAGLSTLARTRQSSAASSVKILLQSLAGGRPPRELCTRAARSE